MNMPRQFGRVALATLLLSLWGWTSWAADYETLMRQGYVAIAEQDYTAALGHFTQAGSLRPGDPYVEVAIQSLQAAAAVASVDQPVSEAPLLLDLGVPANRIPAAVRSEACGSGTDSQDLLPLIPADLVGVTLQAQPTLLLAIPNSTTATELDLAIDGEIFTYALNPEGGIIALELPVELEPGDQITWGVELLCSRDPAQNPAVRGELIRANRPEVDSALATATGSARLALYRSLGAWYDIAAELATALRQDPDDDALQTQWQALLQSQDLGSLAEVNLASCCTAP